MDNSPVTIRSNGHALALTSLIHQLPTQVRRTLQSFEPLIPPGLLYKSGTEIIALVENTPWMREKGITPAQVEELSLDLETYPVPQNMVQRQKGRVAINTLPKPCSRAMEIDATWVHLESDPDSRIRQGPVIPEYADNDLPDSTTACLLMLCVRICAGLVVYDQLPEEEALHISTVQEAMRRLVQRRWGTEAFSAHKADQCCIRLKIRLTEADDTLRDHDLSSKITAFRTMLGYISPGLRQCSFTRIHTWSCSTRRHRWLTDRYERLGFVELSTKLNSSRHSLSRAISNMLGVLSPDASPLSSYSHRACSVGNCTGSVTAGYAIADRPPLRLIVFGERVFRRLIPEHMDSVNIKWRTVTGTIREKEYVCNSIVCWDAYTNKYSNLFSRSVSEEEREGDVKGVWHYGPYEGGETRLVDIEHLEDDFVLQVVCIVYNSST